MTNNTDTAVLAPGFPVSTDDVLARALALQAARKLTEGPTPAAVKQPLTNKQKRIVEKANRSKMARDVVVDRAGVRAWRGRLPDITTRKEIWIVERLVFIEHEVECLNCNQTWTYPNPNTLMRLRQKYTSTVHETALWPVKPPVNLPVESRLLSGQTSTHCLNCRPSVNNTCPDMFAQEAQIEIHTYVTTDTRCDSFKRDFCEPDDAYIIEEGKPLPKRMKKPTINFEDL